MDRWGDLDNFLWEDKWVLDKIFLWEIIWVDFNIIKIFSIRCSNLIINLIKWVFNSFKEWDNRMGILVSLI